MTTIEQALTEALRQAFGPPRYVNFGTFDLTDADYLACAHWLLATEAMQDWLRGFAKDIRGFAKDIGAAAYAEGWDDREMNPEPDR